MKPHTILLMVILVSTLTDHLQAEPRQDKKPSRDPFQMGSLKSNESVNFCVKNISTKEAESKCGLGPEGYLRCCSQNAADCLKENYCSETKGAGYYFDALVQIGAVFPSCGPADSCQDLERDDIGLLMKCLQPSEDAFARCPHMDAETHEARCGHQKETLDCFKKVVAGCKKTVAAVATRYLEEVANADYFRYCWRPRDDTKRNDNKPDGVTDDTTDTIDDDDDSTDETLDTTAGTTADTKDNTTGGTIDGAARGSKGGWRKWLLVLGALALVLLAVVAAIVGLYLLWKRKKQAESSKKLEEPSDVTVEAGKSHDEVENVDVPHEASKPDSEPDQTSST